MAWLVAEGRVLATVEVADTIAGRLRGLIGRPSLDGALLLDPARGGVHTFGLRFAIDVAFLDADLCVLDLATMVPNRLGRPRKGTRAILEAPKGSFERWQLAIGDQLELRT